MQIDVPETLDIADRADFYDATGAMLDMLATHLFQVAAEVALEPPLSMDPEDVQAARESVIAAFRPLDPKEVVLGQYASYLDTEGVEKDSKTETFVAARLWIDTDRWRGVPFLLRTGKMMKESAQKVSLIFKPSDGPLDHIHPDANAIVFDLKGNGAIDIRLTVKKPGPDPLPAESATSLSLANVAPGSMAPVHLADPRRAGRQPDAVHQLHRPGVGLPGLPADAVRRPPRGRDLRRPLVGPAVGQGAHRPVRLAARRLSARPSRRARPASGIPSRLRPQDRDGVPLAASPASGRLAGVRAAGAGPAGAPGSPRRRRAGRPRR